MYFNMSGSEVPFELWDPKISPTYRWILKVQTVLEPIIIALGMLGNILATIVFMTKRLRITSCCLYLAAKCIGDAIFLTALFIVWLYRVHAPVLNNTGICQVTVFVSYACSFTSVWFIVLVAHENYVRIARPHQVRIYCTHRRALVNISIVFFSAAIIYHFHLWTTQVLTNDDDERMCMALARYYKLLATINVIDLVVTLIVPCLLIIMLMLATLVAVVQAMERKKRLTESLMGNERYDNPYSKTVEMKVAKFLTIVSLTLIILHSPSHIIRLKMLIASLASQKHPSYIDYSLQRVFEVMYYLNFSGNLVIFVSAGDKFRRIFIRKLFWMLCSPYRDLNPTKMKAASSLTSDMKQCMELTIVNTAFDYGTSYEEEKVVSV